MATDALHDGHRQRMRDRIERNGLEGLEIHEVVEYLLFSFVPRRDTNAIAHRLINEFGSLSGIMNASVDRIESVKGMTHNAALFLSTLPDVFRKYLVELEAPRQSLAGRGSARAFLGGKLFGVGYEIVYAAAVDAHDQLIDCSRLSTGSGDAVDLSIRKITDYALRHNASGILLAHNHPSGNVQPSHADVELTFQALVTLANVGVKLLDHFIFCGSEYYSFEEKGQLNQLNNVNKMLKEGLYFYDN